MWQKSVSQQISAKFGAATTSTGQDIEKFAAGEQGEPGGVAALAPAPSWAAESLALAPAAASAPAAAT